MTVISNFGEASNSYVVSSGSNNVYSVTLNPALASLTDGLIIYMKANFLNTGAATLAVNSLGAKSIKKPDGSDISSGDIPLNGIAELVFDGANFQLLGISGGAGGAADETLIKINTSNLFRVFDVVQGSHPGALLMEKGWSDSFGNANEQGANEANSTGELHDNTAKLYKGAGGQTGADSDFPFTTEANYLQQEFTNANQPTSQATFTNASKTVTISSGAWPANIANARIKANADGTFIDIDTRDSDTQVTLKDNFTGTTGEDDYTIRMTEFAAGAVKLNESGLSGIGDGRDGVVNITTGVTKTIDNEVVGSLRSTNPDAIERAVTTNPIGTSISVAAGEEAGFAAGDIIILWNKQGGNDDIADVGNYESLTVASTASETINTNETIAKLYEGADFAAQKVTVQRVAQYSSVTLNHASAVLTCNAWNGTKGGTLPFVCNGTVAVTLGKIHADAKGYRGGAGNSTSGLRAFQGESRPGTGTQSETANNGGGGGGLWTSAVGNSGGAGGAHKANGADSTALGVPIAIGGTAYGVDDLTAQLFLGSAGGGANKDAVDGGDGGGIIRIIANTINVVGTITADGGAGGINGGFGSGGGAGGPVLLISATFTPGATTIAAVLGIKGATNGGDGSDGRIGVEYTTINSNAWQNVTEENLAANPDPVHSAVASLANVINEPTAVIPAFNSLKFSANTLDINLVARTETINGETIKYAFIFAPSGVTSYNDTNLVVAIFNQTESVWKKVLNWNGTGWERNSDVTDTNVFTATLSTGAGATDIVHALSEALDLNGALSMTGDKMREILGAEFEEEGGFIVGTHVKYGIALMLKSLTVTNNPSVDQIRTNWDTERAAMDLRSKAYDAGFSPAMVFLWAKAEHSAADGAGTFHVSRNGGTDWEVITMTQQGNPLSGNIRILRGMLTFTTGSGGQDLRARYVTASGKDQLLHSWGIQART